MPSGKKSTKSWLSSLKALIIAPLIFLIILGAIFAYSGEWPPMVVIESRSMQHSDDTSYIGIIDTGDIVIVKNIDSLDEVTTYLDAVPSGYSTYGELGDVVIYYKSGMSKPIIHRAICNLVYNSTGGGFDVPALENVPSWMWSVTGERTWWNLKGTLELHGIGYRNATLYIQLDTMLEYMSKRPLGVHGGLITMGDYNVDSSNGTVVGQYDQKSLGSSIREPIIADWVLGKARGELPWFGLLKLYATGTAPDYTPRNSQTDLVVSIVLIITVPVALDVANSLLKRRGIDMFGWTKRLSPRRLWRRPKEKEPPT